MIPNEYQLQLFRQKMENFVLFTEDEWDLLKPGLCLEQLEKKKLFVQEGKVCKKVAFVLSGALRYYHTKGGEEITGYFFLEHDWVSAYKSFLKQEPSVVTIEAIEATELITFSYQQLLAWQNAPELAFKIERFGRLIAEYLICCYEDRVSSFVLQSAEERYRHLLQNNSRVLQRIPQQYIANYLGVTAVSLSRIRKRILSPM